MAMPATIGKGWILTKLDAVVGSPDLNDVITKLKDPLYDDGAQLADLFSDVNVTIAGQLYKVLDNVTTYRFRRSGLLTEKQHALQHWFGNWWVDDQPTAPILRVGLLEAFQTCRDPTRPRPLDTYWVCAGYEVEVAIATSDQQVTLMILTPRPEDQIVEVHNLAEPIRIVERSDDYLSITTKQLKAIRK